MTPSKCRNAPCEPASAASTCADSYLPPTCTGVKRRMHEELGPKLLRTMKPARFRRAFFALWCANWAACPVSVSPDGQIHRRLLVTNLMSVRHLADTPKPRNWGYQSRNEMNSAALDTGEGRISVAIGKIRAWSGFRQSQNQAILHPVRMPTGLFGVCALPVEHFRRL